MATNTIAKRKKSDWWEQEGFLIAGGWHPLSGRIRSGGNAENEEELYSWEYTEAHLRRLKKLGITLLIGQCDRGLSPGDQKESQKLAKKMAGLCHKHGIRHGSYMANTIYFESMLKELPDCEDWAVHTADGRKAHYGGEQTWRWVACFNSPGWRLRMKREIDIAITEVKTDWLHFDNLAVWPEPDSCHCKYCRESFRSFLLSRYPDRKAQKKRFGFDAEDFSTFVGPTFYLRFIEPWTLNKIHNPLMQDWIDFRAHTVTEYIREMSAYARSLKPDIGIDSNGQSIWGTNQALLHGIRHDKQISHVDMFWEENTDKKAEEPRSDIALIKTFRGMNYGRRMGKAVVTAYHDAAELARNITLAGHPGINVQWGYAEPKKAPLREPQPGVAQLLDFYKRNTAFYTQGVPAARIAVWRNYHSLAYDSFAPHHSACTMEYLLLKRQIPFNIIMDCEFDSDNPLDMDLLIIPNMQQITDDEAAKIIAYVKRGGSLLFTEKSGSINEDQRLRVENVLSDLFPNGYKSGRCAREETATFDPNQQFRDSEMNGMAVFSRCGKGKVVYLPTIDYVHSPRSLPGGFYNIKYQGCDSRYWQEPKNAEEIIAAVEWLCPDYRPFRFYGEDIVFSFLRRKDNALAVPFFRTDDGPVRDYRFVVNDTRRPKQGRVMNPEEKAPAVVEWRENGCGWETVLTGITRHAIITWKL
jgi:hypothetical protein